MTTPSLRSGDRTLATEVATRRKRDQLSEFFGNPSDGTFLAWLADGGLYAILIGLGAVAAWYLAHKLVWRRLRLRRVSDESSGEATAQIDTAVRAGGGILNDVLWALALGAAGVVGILIVLGQSATPIYDYIAQQGVQLWENVLVAAVKIAVIIVLGWFAILGNRRLTPRLVVKFTRAAKDATDRDEAVRKRADTVSAVMIGTVNVVIILVVVFTALTIATVPVGPVVAGLGIAGIAVGFGAQYLVRDLITGILIIAENQYRQGDVVEIAGIAGLVESVNLRRTVLRDLEGKVHVIPHGSVTTTTNFTKYWSRVLLDIGVAYKEEADHVISVLDGIGQDLANDPYFGLLIIDPPKVLRINSFDDSAITFRVLGVCKPMKQWEIAGEMRKRIMKRFVEEGIEIPFPHRTVYWGVDQPKLPWDKSANGTSGDGRGSADEYMPPGTMTPSQREAALAEMALTARAASELMQETRLLDDASRASQEQPGNS